MAGQKVLKLQQHIISFLSFVVWVFALGGPFLLFSWYNPLYGEILLPVYKVNYLTACAVLNFDDPLKEGPLTKRDRYDNAGHGIPSGVVIAFLPSRIMEYTGRRRGIYYRTGGGVEEAQTLENIGKLFFERRKNREK